MLRINSAEQRLPDIIQHVNIILTSCCEKKLPKEVAKFSAGVGFAAQHGESFQRFGELCHVQRVAICTADLGRAPGIGPIDRSWEMDETTTPLSHEQHEHKHIMSDHEWPQKIHV